MWLCFYFCCFVIRVWGVGCVDVVLDVSCLDLDCSFVDGIVVVSFLIV